MDRQFKTLAAFLGVATLTRLALLGLCDLKVEEAYYWDYAQHPSLSYFDHPLGVAFLIRLSTALGGNSALFVRLPALLLSVLGTLLLYDMVRRLSGPRPAMLSAVLFNLLPTFSFHSIFILPDAPLLFFWMVGIWAGARLILSEDTRWWWVVGLATGLGMDSKYPALLIPLGLFLYCGRFRPHLLWCRSMLGAAVLANLLFLPVVIWNAQHDWASIRFQGAERLDQALSVGDRLSSYALQLLMLGPVGFFALIWALLWAWRERGRREVRYFLCWSLPFLGLMVVVSLRRQVQMTWPMPGYVGALPLLSMALDDLWLKGHRRSALALGLGVLLGGAFFTFTPVFTLWRPLAVLNPLLNRIDDVSGWRELCEPVAELRAGMPHPERTFLAGHGYQAAAEVAYCLNMPHLTLANNVLGQRALAFDFWEQPQAFQGWDAIYVVYLQPTSSGEWRERVGLDRDQLRRCFERVDEPIIRSRYQGGAPLRQLQIYLCYSYKGPLQ